MRSQVIIVCVGRPRSLRLVSMNQVKSEVTLKNYTDFRGVGLRSSKSYRTMVARDRRYLSNHEDELAELGETSFVPTLLGVSAVDLRWRNVLG